MKTKTEIHHYPNRVSVFDGGGRQVVNVLGEQCVTGYLHGVARALAKGYANACGPVTLVIFNDQGREVRRQTVSAAPRVVREAKTTPQHVGIFGTSTEGKTALASRIAEKMQSEKEVGP